MGDLLSPAANRMNNALEKSISKIVSIGSIVLFVSVAHPMPDFFFWGSKEIIDNIQSIIIPAISTMMKAMLIASSIIAILLVDPSHNLMIMLMMSQTLATMVVEKIMIKNPLLNEPEEDKIIPNHTNRCGNWNASAISSKRVLLWIL